MAEAAERLTSRDNILVRAGRHCAPLAHQTLGTFPDGTIRLSMGYFNTLQDLESAVQAIRRIAIRGVGTIPGILNLV
jgi:selenocysteine lyase/cysteine desulfurase